MSGREEKPRSLGRGTGIFACQAHGARMSGREEKPRSLGRGTGIFAFAEGRAFLHFPCWTPFILGHAKKQAELMLRLQNYNWF
jgi:hypothetical protein